MQKLTRSLAMAGALAFAGVLAGCGDDVTVKTPTTVTVTPGSASLRVGESVTLTASVSGDVANKTVTWTSSDQAKATVDASGKVTAVASGQATIVATSTADPDAKASALITVLGKGVTGITVSPSNAILAPTQTLQAVANVTADGGVARTVTWSSSSNAVATVSTAGVITAVAPGTASIIATSTVDATVTGALALTVRAPVPAQISIQKVTTTGNTNGTVNFNNVAGGIDVTLNVDPGDAVLSRVEVLLDNNVVCSQNLSASQSQELRLAAAFEELQAADVVCQINTAEFNAATGAVKYTNGQHTLSARAIVAAGGSGNAATPSVALTFNNQSGVVATLTNDNGTDPASAVNPASGLQWLGGSVTVNVVGVSYAPGVSIASANFTVFGKSRTVALTNNVGSATYSEGTTWTATNTGVGNYLSPAAGETFTGATAVLSNGQNLVTTLPSVILNFGSPAQGNANVPILPTIRLDNTAPGQTSANAIAQTAIAIGTMPVWVNATTAFAPGSVGIPSNTTLATSEQVAGASSGVDNVTTTVYFGAAGSLAGTYNPGGLSNLTGVCNLTGLTALTVGQNLPETIVSGSYQARVQFKDAVGNAVCFDLNPVNALNPGANGSFGADFTAPTGTITGPAANSAFQAQGAVPNFAVTATDNASGFGATPLNVIVTRTNAGAANTCVIGSGTGCVTPAARALTFDATNATAAPTSEGYYTNTISLVDQAGNATTLVTGRVFLLDDPAQVSPGSTADVGFTGGISLPSVIAGATTNNFAATPIDDIDLASVFGVAAYPTASIRYPSQTLGTYDTPLERGGTGLNYGATNWMRCINAAADFATTTNQPTGITLTATDQAGNTGSLASPAFGANAQPCGAVGDVTINTFGPLAASYGGTKTQVDIDGASLATASSSTVAFTVVADVPLNTSNNPFARVDFYFQDLAGNLRLVGSGSGVLAQSPTNRTWTYTFTWDPSADVQVGVVNVVAIGVDAQGDAVLSNAIGGVTVTTVP